MKKMLLLSLLLSTLFVLPAQKRCGTVATGSSGGVYGSSGYYNMGPPVMSEADLHRVLDLMDRQHFDDDKRLIAMQAMRGMAPSSVQVREMTEDLIFESSKVAFAKEAYTYTWDQQNYYLVSAAFTFSSSTEELAAYTASVGYSSSGSMTYANGGSNGSCGTGVVAQGHTCTSSCNHGSVGVNGYYGGAQGHTCTSSCNHGSVGVNGYYGGGQGSVGVNGYYGSGSQGSCGTNGYYNIAPAMPACGLCSGYHDVSYICDQEFATMCDAVYGRTFESDKLCMAKQAIGNRWVSAVQVARMMGYFTFESTKLDFAKWAYRHCWDQASYYIVNDAFTFRSSARELDEFIKFG